MVENNLAGSALRPTVRPSPRGTRPGGTANAMSAARALIAWEKPRCQPAHPLSVAPGGATRTRKPGRPVQLPFLVLCYGLDQSSELAVSTPEKGKSGDFARTLFMPRGRDPPTPKTRGARRNSLGNYLSRTRLPGGASVPQPLS